MRSCDLCLTGTGDILNISDRSLMTGGGGGGYKMVKDEDKLNIYCTKKCVCVCVGGGG